MTDAVAEATVQAALTAAALRLQRAGVPEPLRDARQLMSAALKVEPDRLILLSPEAMGPEEAGRLSELVADRCARRPVSHILGRRLFWGRSFEISPAVLDPRPETETLVAAALSAPPPRRVLDLGVGSGAILLSLLAEWPAAEGVGADVSTEALAVAARNAGRLGVAGRALFIRSDWFADVAGTFDLIVANPPYIPAAEVERLEPEVRDWEPRVALTPGPTGLEAYAAIAAGLRAALDRGGRALLEIGAGQQQRAAALFQAAGFSLPRAIADLDGRARVLEVRG